MSATETCWKDDCDKPVEVDYWCSEHATERRERIRRALADIANDKARRVQEQEPPRAAHVLYVTESEEGWTWTCSCGSGGSKPTRTQGMASGAGNRHVKSAEKASA